MQSISQPTQESAIVFRRASRDDVHSIVQMLDDDPLGARREAFTLPLPESYYHVGQGASGRHPVL